MRLVSLLIDLRAAADSSLYFRLKGRERRQGGENVDVFGEQLAQVDNHDPFAPPAWRSRSCAPPAGSSLGVLPGPVLLSPDLPAGPAPLTVRDRCHQLAGHGEERSGFVMVAEAQHEQPGGDQLGERPLPDRLRGG